MNKKHQIPNNHQVQEEDGLDTDEMKEMDRSNGERFCLNVGHEEDEEQVTNITE